MGWKSIKTAPKNKQILVTGFGYENFEKTKRRFYAGAKWSHEHRNFVDPWREDHDETFVLLTHWMDIPKI